MITPRHAAIPRLAFGGLTLFAIARQLAIQIDIGASVVNFFSFFTNLSNIFAAAVAIIGAFGYRAAVPAIDTLRLIAVVNMTIVGVVFSVLLRDLDLGSLLPWINVVLHYVMPVVVVLDWLLVTPRRRLTRVDYLWCLPLPLVYLGYTMARGAAIGWYPYPFLRSETTGGYAGVAIYVAAIVALFLLTGLAAVSLANRSSRRLPPARD